MKEHYTEAQFVVFLKDKIGFQNETRFHKLFYNLYKHTVEEASVDKARSILIKFIRGDFNNSIRVRVNGYTPVKYDYGGSNKFSGKSTKKDIVISHCLAVALRCFFLRLNEKESEQKVHNNHNAIRWLTSDRIERSKKPIKSWNKASKDDKDFVKEILRLVEVLKSVIEAEGLIQLGKNA